MANTLAGVNLAEIAQQSLPGLSSLFAPLSGIHTDFSNDLQSRGESVTTRFPTKPTASSLASGYVAAAQDVAMTARTITLNQFKGFVYGFDDLERSKSSIDLQSLFIEPAQQAVGDAVFGDLWNLVTAANFATSSTITAGNFGRDDLVDLGTTLTATKKAPQSNRFVLCNPSYYGALVKTLNSAEIPGITEGKTEGIVPRVNKFDVYETDLADANSENLAAFAAHKTSLLMASRTVDAGSFDGELENVVIPGIGLTVQFRKWYSNDTGVDYISMGILYGVSKGVDYGVRVTSA